MKWARSRFWVVAMILVVLATAPCSNSPDNSDGVQSTTSPPDAVPPPTAVPLPLPPEVIYIIDPNGGNLISNIIVLDGATAKTVKTYRVRYTPSIAFSTDGSAMYVADSYQTRVTRGEMNSYISSFDTRTGSLLTDDVPLTDRTLYKFYPIGDPMFFASDGGDVLFSQKYGEPDPRIAVLDPDSFEVIEEAQTPSCGWRITASADEWLCVNASGRVDDGFTTTASIIDPIEGIEIKNLAVFQSDRVVEAVKPSDADVLFILTQGGRVTAVDLLSGAITQADLEHEDNLSLGQIGTLATTPDGSRLFVGFIGDDEEHRGFVVSEIRVNDTTSWKLEGTIEPDDPPMHFAISENGHRLYAVSPFEQSIAIYNTSDLELTAFRTGVGGTPARIVIPPLMNSSSAKSD